MSNYRPLKSVGAGKLQEFTLSDEDYLAYQSGIHLSQMDSDDVSALTRVDQGSELVGTFTNTTFVDGTEGTPLTLSTTINVAINATTASGIHTNTITGGGLPGTVYVGDTLQLNFDGTATETGGGGFETIQYAVATSGTAEFTQSITATPAPTSIGDDDITW